jgi:DNA polymerase-3 subunit delta'
MKDFHIKGHRNVRLFLKNILSEDRVGHAYLFSGREGIGKKLVALEFSMNLLGTNLSPEEKSGKGQQILKGTHPDVKEIQPERERSSAKEAINIETIRNAQEWLSLAPMEGCKKVLIVDKAHTMNDHAANAFLKSLEEPPPSGVIILVTPQPYQMLPTILSRCQVVRFAPLKTREVEEILLTRGLEPLRAKELASLAHGSVSKALELNQKRGLEILKYAESLFSEAFSPMSAVETISWKRDKENVLKVLVLLRIMLRKELVDKGESPLLWKRHKLLAKLEENLYQYQINPQLTLEYLEIKWKSLKLRD